MRFSGTCYRAHDPRWSFKPTSGEGAAVRGARFNPKGVPALYLALGIVTAIKEVNHGLARRIDPCVLCAYEVDCEDIVDLTSPEDRAERGIRLDDMNCAWMQFLAERKRPPSWGIYDKLAKKGTAGILVPSFAPGADAAEHNFVLWHWSERPPHQVRVIDPEGRLPHNQLSWR
ncbi:RES family NAD+ phosphorylase [Chelativorans alearense]|uniref:RES family NAD+ phosphorylase n=1 Tax=Chelativorans alearense TaxID=2681495 RepID=UPI0013D3658E|nr:RES family NAD+ phosphorylase [Chelativorans alearense]